jgi:hypothetical protein
LVTRVLARTGGKVLSKAALDRIGGAQVQPVLGPKSKKVSKASVSS